VERRAAAIVSGFLWASPEVEEFLLVTLVMFVRAGMFTRKTTVE
jgi:hypothetical protein